jgi:uncharacterized integral membrane protein
MNSKNIVFISFLVLLLIILLQNTEVVAWRLLFWKVEMSRAIMMPLVLLIGFVAGFFTSKALSHFRKSSKNKHKSDYAVVKNI